MIASARGEGAKRDACPSPVDLPVILSSSLMPPAIIEAVRPELKSNDKCNQTCCPCGRHVRHIQTWSQLQECGLCGTTATAVTGIWYEELGTAISAVEEPFEPEIGFGAPSERMSR
jgi:hypothetical protein